jgi:tetratricopeptide (TPR) repeat protein
LEAAFSSSYASESKKDYVQSIHALKAVYSEKSYEINLRLGWLHYNAALYLEGQNYYAEAIKLRPNSIEAKMGYVLPASALGNWDNVLAQYMDILKIDAQNSVVNYRVGMIYYNRKDYTNAEKYFDKVVTIYPFSYDGVIMLALAKLKLKKTVDAKVLFNNALLLSPGDVLAKEGLSLIE